MTTTITKIKYTLNQPASCPKDPTTTLHYYFRKTTSTFSVECLFHFATRIENQNSNNGITTSAAITALEQRGQCYEHEWPYQAAFLKNKQQPPNNVFFYKATSCLNPSLIPSIQKELKRQNPILVILRTTKGFCLTDGKEPLQYKTLDQELGTKHAVLLVGYKSNSFIIRNSWGTNWGDDGHALIEQNYLSKRSDSILTISKLL